MGDNPGVVIILFCLDPSTSPFFFFHCFAFDPLFLLEIKGEKEGSAGACLLLSPVWIPSAL